MRPRLLAARELPTGVQDLAPPPERLWLHGAWPDGPVVALVGTRHPSSEGAAFTRELAAELAAAGVVVASGGAEGIDTAAHQGALEQGARTLVVAPSGFARPFPEENGPFFRDLVARGGGYVSEHAPEEAASRHVFFRRNALLVSLSRVLVVVECPRRSGARNAAQWARRLGRPWLVVPHSPWNPKGAGWLEEHRLGAGLATSSRCVLAVLEGLNAHAIPAALAGPEQLTLPVGGALRERVLVLLAQPRHLDELVVETGASPAALQEVLSELCLAGIASLGALGIAKLTAPRRKGL